MEVIRICTHAKGEGNEITDELAKYPGWRVAAVFPLGHVFHGENHPEFFVLLREE
jgi:hypothetical protein